MEVLYPKCAGLDVHKDVVVACARNRRRRTSDARGPLVRHDNDHAAVAAAAAAQGTEMDSSA